MNEEKKVKTVAKRVGLITNVLCVCVFAVICYITKTDLKVAVLALVVGELIGLLSYFPVYGILKKRMNN